MTAVVIGEMPMKINKTGRAHVENCFEDRCMPCPCRIELSLRSSAPKAMVGLEDLQEGQTVSGRVRRVEGYGVFISLAGSGVTGLCHISEVADEKVTDLPGMFQPGQGVYSSDMQIPGSLYQWRSIKRGCAHSALQILCLRDSIS